MDVQICADFETSITLSSVEQSWRVMAHSIELENAQGGNDTRKNS